MLVTIIADASHCPETNACGWAYWIASERGKKGGEGYEAKPVANSIAAEMLALLHGLLNGCTSGLIHPFDNLLMQTDCMAAIDAFEDRRKRITSEEKEIVEQYRSLKYKLDLKIEFRHVRGHTYGGSPSTRTNNICDALAGEAMRKAQKQFRKQKPKVSDPLGPPWDV